MQTKILKKYHIQIIFYILSTLISLSIPVLLSYLIDTIILKNQYSNIKIWFAFAFIITIIASISNFYFVKYIPAKKGIENSILLQKKSLNNILHMNVPSFEGNDKAYYFNILINSTGSYGDLHEELYLHLIANVLCTIIIIIFIFSVSILFGILFLIYIPVLVIISFSQSKSLFRLQKDAIIRQDSWMSSLKNIIESKKQINALQANDFFENHFNNNSSQWLKYILKYKFYQYLVENIPSIINNLYSIIFLAIGVLLIQHNSITPGLLLLGYQYLSYISGPIADSINIIIRFNAGREHIRRVDDLEIIADTTNEIEPYKILKDKLFITDRFIFKKGIETNDLLYTIKDLSIDLNKFYVIKGSNGSGKTMFMNLIMGNISIKNSEGSFSVIKCTEDIIFLTYPLFFVDGSFDDNLFHRTYNKELLEILNINFDDKEIKTNPLNLSLGQQQKIALLRLLSLEKPILLLDEPFSNLDTQTQLNLKNYFIKLKGTKTILFVMHDNSLDDICDEVITIKDNLLFIEKQEYSD